MSRAHRSSHLRARLLSLVLGALVSAGCDPKVIEKAGPLRSVTLRVKLLGLDDTERSAIGSFQVEVLRNGALEATSAVSFDAATGELAFPREPPTIAGGGRVEVRVAAVGLNGLPLDIGGRTAAVVLDGLDPNAAVTAPVLVGRLGAMTPLGQELQTPRFLHTVTPAGPGAFLVVGGATQGDVSAPTGFATDVEWIDPLAGLSCASGVVGTCNFGDAGAIPSSRIEHVAVDLDAAFAPSCPHRGVLVAGGAGSGGQAFVDAFLFDPTRITSPSGAFTKLPDLPRARRGAGAAALGDCRVLLFGGAGADGQPIAAVDVIDLSGDTPTVSPLGVDLPHPGIHPLVIPTANNLEEVIVAGGEGADGALLDGAVALQPAASPQVCDLTDPSGALGCNLSRAPLVCARAHGSVARLDVAPEAAPALIVGGAGASCTSPIEAFRGSVTTPIYGFTSLLTSPLALRTAGATATALRGGSALVVGGVDAAGLVLANAQAAELFVPRDVDLEVFGALAGNFLGPIPAQARAFHAAAGVGEGVVVVGGLDAAGAVRGDVEFYLEDWR